MSANTNAAILKNNKEDYDLIIVGSGPAGMTAAIYAKRANLKVAVIEKEAPGGKMIKTFEVENYPGFDYINGQELSLKMQNQIEKLDIKIIYNEVVRIDDTQNHKLKIVTFTDDTSLTAKAIIVATGCVENKLGIPGEDEYYGKGVSYCGVCDGFLFKNKVITVVGGGYAACEESLYLTRVTDKLNLIHRREVFRADDSTVEKVKNHPNITVYINYRVIEVIGGDKTTDKVVGLKLENVLTKEVKEIKTDALFPYIGSKPISFFVSHLGILDKEGYILVDDICQTKVPGLFAAGDVIQKKLRQIVTATNDGAVAAQYVINFIDNIS